MQQKTNSFHLVELAELAQCRKIIDHAHPVSAAYRALLPQVYVGIHLTITSPTSCPVSALYWLLFSEFTPLYLTLRRPI